MRKGPGSAYDKNKLSSILYATYKPVNDFQTETTIKLSQIIIDQQNKMFDTTILKIFGFHLVPQFPPPIKMIYDSHNIHRITSDMKVKTDITESYSQR
jgi:hypothetical protein